MSLWRPARYYCINTAKPCRYAVGDIPFTAAECRGFGGYCRGTDADGCGAPLVAGTPRDLRLRIVLVSVLVLAVGTSLGWLVRAHFFPHLQDNLRFAAAETRVEDNAGLVQLDVVRERDTQGSARVTYTFNDGSAKAGEDYEAVQSVLTFLPGESHKSIPVMVLPDVTSEKAARYFTLTLSNVLGSPRHIVHIVPHPVDRTVELQVEQAVKAASRNGADVGTYMTRTETLLGLLQRKDLSRKRAAEYQSEYDTANGNLSRCRDAYSQSLHLLETFQAPLVMRTLDRVHEDLLRQNFMQQARAVSFVKAHLKELLEKRTPDVERWAKDLRTTVPRPDPATPAPRPVTQGSST